MCEREPQILLLVIGPIDCDTPIIIVPINSKSVFGLKIVDLDLFKFFVPAKNSFGFPQFNSLEQRDTPLNWMVIVWELRIYFAKEPHRLQN